MWINRQIADSLATAATQFPAIVLTGARQTGKTSLLRHLWPDASFVSLDLPSNAAQADTDGELFLSRHPEPVLIDEIQYAPNLFRHLKTAIDADRARCGRFIMTGSQKFSLMASLSESLAGRVAVMELDTLSALEIGAAHSVPAEDLLWRGGYPELWNRPQMDAKLFFSSYVATCLERDVRQLMRVGSLRDFERFVRACALRSGQLLNLSELGRDTGISGTTARDWLSVLEASNHVCLLEPFYSNPGVRLIKSPKLYFRDTGLLCFLLGMESPAALASSPLIGAVWETFVLGQLLRAKDAAGSALRVCFWRDAHGREVDFVIEQNARLRLVEAKWTALPGTGRDLNGLRHVLAHLGDRATPEHWLACRTPNEHLLPGTDNVRAINATNFTRWTT